MPDWYAHWIDAWERRLASRDTNRIVRPFEWGLDWLNLQSADGDPAREVARWAEKALEDSDQLFAHRPPVDFSYKEGHLTFQSAVVSPHPENNVVHADFFPVAGRRGRAVLVLPQWNAVAKVTLSTGPSCRSARRLATAGMADAAACSSKPGRAATIPQA